MTDFNMSMYKFPPLDGARLKRTREAVAEEARQLWEACDKYGTEFRTAVDAGANVGTMSHILSQIYKNVLAYEPWPEAFSLLKKNSVYFPCANVTLSSLALGKERKDGVMYSGHPSRRDAHLSESTKPNTGSSSNVKVVPLDDVIGDYCVDLLKIDTEGNEIDVMNGASGVIKDYKPLIFVEIKWEKELYFDYFKSIDYHQVGNWSHNYAFVSR